MTMTTADHNAMFRAQEKEALDDPHVMALAKAALALAKREGRAKVSAGLPAKVYFNNDEHNIRIERLEFFVGGCTGRRGGLVGYMTADDVMACATHIMLRASK